MLALQQYRAPSKRESLSSVSPQLSKTQNRSFEGRPGIIVSYFIPDDDPNDVKQLPSTSSSSTDEMPAQASFKELFLKKLEKCSTSKPKAGKHRKVNPYGAIVTSDEEFASVIEEAEQKKKPKQKRKQAMQEEESETDESVELQLESGTNKDFSDEEPIFPEHSLFPPVTERQSYLHLKPVWSEINPPVAEYQLVGKFFAGIYYSDSRGKKVGLYIGKVILDIKLFKARYWLCHSA